MRKAASLVCAAVVMFAVMMLVGCGGGGGSSIKRIEINPDTANLAAGSQQQFTVTGYKSDDTPLPLEGDWSVTGPIGTIDQDGLFTATTTTSSTDPASGTVNVEAKGKTASAQVTVVPGTVSGIVIVPPEGRDLSRIPAGQQLQFTAEGVDQYGNRGETTRITLSGPVTWGLTGDIGSIDSNGLFSAALDSGVTSASGTITADYEGYHASVDVTVTKAKWTFMVYLDADNSLDSFADGDLNEMERVGSNDEVNIVVQLDKYGDTGTWRYLMQQDDDDGNVTSTPVQTLAEQNMGQASTLADFVQWAQSNYPAQHYCLVLWDHGSGWDFRARTRPVRAICQDSSSGGDWLNLPEVKTALEGFDNLDVLDFDACVMGMASVYYQLRDLASYIVASEDEVPAYGLPYDRLLEWLEDAPDSTAQALAEEFVDAYAAEYSASASNRTLAAIDTSKLSALASAVDTLASALISHYPADKDEMASAMDNAEDFSCSMPSMDLWDFAYLVGQIDDDTIQAAAAAVENAVETAVVSYVHSDYDSPNAHGLAIYGLNTDNAYDDDYDTLDFAAATHWDEFLQLTDWENQ